MSAMPGMRVQSVVCADVARCGSGMSGMWAGLSRQLHDNRTLVLLLLMVIFFTIKFGINDCVLSYILSLRIIIRPMPICNVLTKPCSGLPERVREGKDK